jgi:hypothetical protein
MAVKIVRVQLDPFGRGEKTVFYRDFNINNGQEIFYLWACHWLVDYPDEPIPPIGFDCEPVKEKRRRCCIPYVLAEPGRLSNLLVVEHRLRR